MQRSTPFWAAVAAIVRKDLRAEIRGRELVGAMGIFALLSVMIFSFALELDREARIEAVSGVLWVTVVFASILGLNRSLALERDQGNLDGLLLAPVKRSAVYIGKLVGNFIFTAVIALLLLPIMTVLYGITLLDAALIGTLLLGVLGFTTVGTLLATMTVQTRSREALLPIVMMPVALPMLLAAVRASTAVMNEASSTTWLAWVGILAALDVIFLTLCFLLFEYVVEE
jgi:heme exporter protein B